MIVVLGPTSSGKSDYAIRLAKEIGGEVISVDSRQVYRGMDIGTGKVTRDPVSCHPELVSGSRTTQKRPPEEILKQVQDDNKISAFFSEGVRHWLLDVASPKREYNVTNFLRDAKRAIADIERRGKVPILCGGTTFWAEALLLGTSFPDVKPDKQLRAKLGKFSADELFKILETKDPERAETIDPHNKVRLIRALEIIEALGKVPALPTNSQQLTVNRKSAHSRHSDPALAGEESLTSSTQTGILHFVQDDSIKIIILSPPKEILHERIERRLKERLEEGMIDEVRRLREEGVSWKRLESFGLEYRSCARFLQEKISHEDLETEILKDIKHYAKRQLTYLRRLERSGFDIEWIA